MELQIKLAEIEAENKTLRNDKLIIEKNLREIEDKLRQLEGKSTQTTIKLDKEISRPFLGKNKVTVHYLQLSNSNEKSKKHKRDLSNKRNNSITDQHTRNKSYMYIGNSKIANKNVLDFYKDNSKTSCEKKAVDINKEYKRPGNKSCIQRKSNILTSSVDYTQKLKYSENLQEIKGDKFQLRDQYRNIEKVSKNKIKNKVNHMYNQFAYENHKRAMSQSIKNENNSRNTSMNHHYDGQKTNPDNYSYIKDKSDRGIWQPKNKRKQSVGVKPSAYQQFSGDPGKIAEKNYKKIYLGRNDTKCINPSSLCSKTINSDRENKYGS